MHHCLSVTTTPKGASPGICLYPAYSHLGKVEEGIIKCLMIAVPLPQSPGGLQRGEKCGWNEQGAGAFAQVPSLDPHKGRAGGRSSEGCSTCCRCDWAAERRPSQLGGKSGLGFTEK